ncbi:hypothetical protein G7054_g11387 [Neopestalotiopsis clavispora]|nr:hypothetical protein G7054_g11387 [Neopestalotiopsis clavispora]
MGSTSSREYPVGEPSASHHRDTSHRHRQNHGSSSKNDRPKRRHHRSKAHYSTSHSPLRGRRRYSSRHKQGDSPNISPNNHRGSRHKRTPSDDGGLLDVLAEILGRGEQGPDAAVLAQLADKFGELIVQGLVDRLVSELESGLLEKILMDYLMDLVKGSVRKGLGRGAHRAAGRGTRGSYDDDDDDDGDWKKSLLKKAVMTVAKSMMKTER